MNELKQVLSQTESSASCQEVRGKLGIEPKPVPASKYFFVTSTIRFLRVQACVRYPKHDLLRRIGSGAVLMGYSCRTFLGFHLGRFFRVISYGIGAFFRDGLIAYSRILSVSSLRLFWSILESSAIYCLTVHLALVGSAFRIACKIFLAPIEEVFQKTSFRLGLSNMSSSIYGLRDSLQTVFRIQCSA